MSNLVHRRRRCARIVSYITLEDRGGAFTRRRISLWLQGSLFCTANSSYFALWLSVCQGQTRRVGKFSQASLLAWMNITTWLQGRKPRESNKLFDLIFPKSESVLSVVEQKLPEDREGLSLFIALRWMQAPGGVMVWRAENIQACLRDFLAATASMARKRHLASTARGFCCFCLTPSIHKPIRPIRGRKEEPILWRTALNFVESRLHSA